MNLTATRIGELTMTCNMLLLLIVNASVTDIHCPLSATCATLVIVVRWCGINTLHVGGLQSSNDAHTTGQDEGGGAELTVGLGTVPHTTAIIVATAAR